MKNGYRGGQWQCSFHDQKQRNAWRLLAVLVAYLLFAALEGRVTGIAFQQLADPEAYYAERYGIGDAAEKKQ